LDGDVAERDARIISSLVSLNCSEIGEVEGDWKDSDNERAALDAAFLGSKRDGFGGSMVYKLGVFTVEQGENGDERGELLVNDVEHYLSGKGIMGILLVENEEGGGFDLAIWGNGDDRAARMLWIAVWTPPGERPSWLGVTRLRM